MEKTFPFRWIKTFSIFNEEVTYSVSSNSFVEYLINSTWIFKKRSPYEAKLSLKSNLIACWCLLSGSFLCSNLVNLRRGFLGTSEGSTSFKFENVSRFLSGLWYCKKCLFICVGRVSSKFLDINPSRPKRKNKRREKIKLNFCFHTSLWCRKRFLGTTKKCENKNLTCFISIRLSENARDVKG